jgi:hypothetical protein
MGIRLAELSTRQQELIDPADRAKLKIKTSEERAAKALRGTEAKEHEHLMGWLDRNEVEFIHAPCRRKVKDLEPGWEDFTVFFRDRYLLLEIKVEGGQLSADQERVQRRHGAKRMPSYTVYSYEDAKDFIGLWLLRNFGWIASA